MAARLDGGEGHSPRPWLCDPISFCIRIDTAMAIGLPPHSRSGSLPIMTVGHRAVHCVAGGWWPWLGGDMGMGGGDGDEVVVVRRGARGDKEVRRARRRWRGNLM